MAREVSRPTTTAVERLLIYWALAGIVAPVALVMATELDVRAELMLAWRVVRLLLWPTSFMPLMNQCPECGEFAPLDLLLRPLSITINSLLYVTVGALSRVLLRRFRA